MNLNVKQDINIDFKEEGDNLVIAKTQHITDEYIQSLKDARFESKNRPAGNYHRAASIPVALHEKWLEEGYDCTQEPIKKTVARLKAEGLDYFVTTDKAL